jgi:DNA-binding response OmpR family regulator
MSSPLAGYSILVFAQEPFSAHCLETLLRGAGAEVIGTASVNGALYAIEQRAFSAGVLDAGVASMAPKQIVQSLTRRGVPCLVCMHCGSEDQNARGAGVVPKPVRGIELIEMLCGIGQQQGRAVRGAYQVAASAGGAPLGLHLGLDLN